jgi:zinc transport system permease protein
LLGMAFTLAGLWVSYQLNLASGATIILVAGVGFFLSLGIDAVGARWKRAIKG